MLMLYFSGTGNSKYIAQLFSKNVGADCYSIEDKLDFKKLINQNDTIAFCYPIYGSSVPRIMREFVTKNAEELKNKKLIIFCTQLMFSGDGARAFTDLLPKGYGEVIYAEHFNMPNNICNFSLFPIKNGEKNKKYRVNAIKKMDKVKENLDKGIVVKRGFNGFSKLMGKSQSSSWPKVEEKNISSVKVDADCIKCGVCVKICPMKNLYLTDEGLKQNYNCILCHRCVNICPQKSITVLLHKKPKIQYKGVSLEEEKLI